MSDSIEVQEIQAQPVLSIRTTCRPEEMGEVLGRILPRVHGFATRRGLKSAGPPFTRYLHWDEPGGSCTLDAGIPLAAPAEGEGDIKAGELPGGRVAVGWHLGPYQALGRTHRAIHEAVASQGLTFDGPCWLMIPHISGDLM